MFFGTNNNSPIQSIHEIKFLVQKAKRKTWPKRWVLRLCLKIVYDWISCNSVGKLFQWHSGFPKQQIILEFIIII